MQKIVVGYDGSDTARKAADEAANLAVTMDAELHVVTVVTDDPAKHGFRVEVAEGEVIDAVEVRREGLRKRAAATAAALDGAYGDLTVVPVVLIGPAARALVEYAEDVDADVIVVGNRRVQGISRVLGSVAIDVLRDARCAVYVAKTT